MVDAKPSFASVPRLEFRTAVVPDAVALVAPAPPTPPNDLGSHAIAWVAVFVLVPVADNVKVQEAREELVNAPTTVPLVNGVVRTRGLSIEKVLEMLAAVSVGGDWS